MDIVERIRSRVKVNETTGCWEWQGAKNTHGYGHMGYDGKSHQTHRLIFFALNPDVSKSLWVLHRCDNPACNNPDHLFPGTPAINSRDRENKGRGNQRGTPGEKHTQAKLTESNVREILVRLSQGDRQVDIAADFGVNRTCITKIKTGESWRHVTLGFVPPAPPARRAVAQSESQTARNVAAANMAMEAYQQMLAGSGTNQPAGVINASAKPEKKQPPSSDLAKRPKRKITLE